MDLETAIRTRRTHKAYRPEPVAREDARRAVRARPLGAQPPPDEPLAFPRRRARARSSGCKRRPVPRRRRSSIAHRRWSSASAAFARRAGPRRGGSARDRLRGLHRAARCARPWARRILADAGGAAQRRRARLGRARRGRALRRPALPRPADAGAAAAGPSAGSPTASPTSTETVPRAPGPAVAAPRQDRGAR